MKRFIMLLVLSGCATAPPPVTVTKTVFVPQKIPPALLDCGAAPAVPAATLQSQVADYVVRLWEWGQGCSDNLAAIKTAVNQQ